MTEATKTCAGLQRMYLTCKRNGYTQFTDKPDKVRLKYTVCLHQELLHILPHDLPSSLQRKFLNCKHVRVPSIIRDFLPSGIITLAEPRGSFICRLIRSHHVTCGSGYAAVAW